MNPNFLCLIALTFTLTSCAASISEEQLNLADTLDREVKSIETKETRRLLVKSPTNKIDLFYCRNPKSRGTAVLIVNEDALPFTGGACQLSMFAPILADGYDVVAMNRPGFGDSVPKKDDFSGLSTIMAIDAVLSSPDYTIEGVWASGSAASAAGFASKKAKKLKWIIFANGIYDAEVFASAVTDTTYKDLIEKARKDPDDSHFFEQRSIAWDIAGLPTTIAIYHARDNAVVPVKQAQDLRDVLNASGSFRVIYDEVQGISHQINPGQQSILMERMLKKMKDPVTL